jgi:hypothetical protein
MGVEELRLLSLVLLRDIAVDCKKDNDLCEARKNGRETFYTASLVVWGDQGDLQWWEEAESGRGMASWGSIGIRAPWAVTKTSRSLALVRTAPTRLRCSPGP